MHHNAKRWSSKNSLNNRNEPSQHTNSETQNQTENLENPENEETSEQEHVQAPTFLKNEAFLTYQPSGYQGYEMMQFQQPSHETMMSNHELMQGQRSNPNHEVMSNQESILKSRTNINQGMTNHPDDFSNYQRMIGGQTAFPNHMEMPNQQELMGYQGAVSHQAMIPNQRRLSSAPIDDSEQKTKRKSSKKDSDGISKAKQSETKSKSKTLKSVYEFIDTNYDEQQATSGKRKRDSNDQMNVNDLGSKKQQISIDY